MWGRLDLEGGAEHMQGRAQDPQPQGRHRNCGESPGMLQAVKFGGFEPVLPTLMIIWFHL